MSWFQISEDYKVSPCGEKEFPEVGWAPIIDDNGAWGWLYLDPGEPYVFFPPMVFPKFSPKVCKSYDIISGTVLNSRREEVVREGKVLYKSLLWEDTDKWSPILLRERGCCTKENLSSCNAPLFMYAHHFRKSTAKKRRPTKTGQQKPGDLCTRPASVAFIGFMSLVLCCFLARNKIPPHRAPLYLFVQPQDIVRKRQQDSFP